MKQKLLILNKPDEVLIPIIDENNDFTIVPKIGEYVYKGSVVAYSKGEIKNYITSPISGKILDIINKPYFDKYIKETKCIIVENDFKEMVEELKGVNKNINSLSKEEFEERLKFSGICDSKTNTPIFNKYQNNIKKIIINTCNIFETNNLNLFLVENYLNEILETIDALLEINKIEECVIVLSKFNHKLIKAFEQKAGTYLKIKIKIISDDFYFEKTSNQEIIYESLENLYYINETLKNNTPITEKFISFINNKENFILKVKLGTKLKFIFNELNNTNDKFIVGNNLNGIKISNKDIMVTFKINSLITYSDECITISSKCIKCGNCALKCPMNLLPLEIIRYKNNKKALNKLNISKCLECGLCSFNCPSNINLYKQIKEIKGDINE